jgi:NAD(P)-dependent dehydrogenase (short-subunit alcohol dehydrogenase family)
MRERKTALVTGGNRGIGFEICRQLARRGWRVLLTARDVGAGTVACERLTREGGDVTFQPLDVTDAEAVGRIRGYVEQVLGRLDVLVNNAGISLERGKIATEVDIQTVRAIMETNLFGPWMLSLALIPIMKKSGGSRIVMVSSGLGSFSKLMGDRPAYRVSKTALNALTVILADELRAANIQVNAMTPGRVRTQLGGIDAPRSVKKGAETAVWLATFENAGPTGKFFKDRQEFPW